MLLTKFLLIVVILAGITTILASENGKVPRLSYTAMWVICILQILTRLLEGY